MRQQDLDNAVRQLDDKIQKIVTDGLIVLHTQGADSSELMDVVTSLAGYLMLSAFGRARVPDDKLEELHADINVDAQKYVDNYLTPTHKPHELN
jgi:hypothetical protein